MNKKEQDIIKSVIKSLLDKRFMVAYEKSGNSLSELYKDKTKDIEFNRSVREKGLYEVLKIDNTHTSFYDRQLIKLNSVLEVKNKVKEVVDLEQQIKRIQAKKYISITEFTEIYGKSKTFQQGLRGRLNNPIPYRQTVKNGAITYEVEVVEKWFKNQYK